MKKLILVTIVLISGIWYLTSPSPTHAAQCGDTVTTDNANEIISDCNAKLSQLSGQKQTLSQVLSILSTQIKLTETKIAAHNANLKILETEISDLSGRIDSLDYSLTDITKLFVARVRANYMSKFDNSTLYLTNFSNIKKIIKGIEYLEKVRDHDRNLLISLEQSRLDLDTQKSAKIAKQAAIAKLKATLDQEKSVLASQVASKNKLLAETNNDEVKYQQLLSSAQRQLAAFRKFATSQGGASILSDQTKCDSWGCYYNQRDAQWGNQTIGLSSETMREVGCLITSVAMITSHYGKSLKPGDIAASNNPFWGNTAYMNLSTWSVNGVTVSRTRLGSSLSKIDEELSSGRPVIVGIYGGPDHFLVITRKDGDDYLMNDPFLENGNNIKFTSKYPLSAISAVDRIIIN